MATYSARFRRPRCSQPGEIIAGVVRRAGQRACRYHQEALGVGNFLISRELVGLRRHDGFRRAVLAQEVRRQNLDAGTRALLSDRPDGLRKMLRTAIGEIVAIDRGDNDVGKPELEGGLRDMLRLAWIERTG